MDNRDVEVTWFCPECKAQNFDNLQTSAILCWACDEEFDWYQVEFTLVEQEDKNE